ncbi:acyl-CoA synthetase short-chain family member 3, mitochondrial isoform X2 [Phycodurus eques]|uniref:acyl-CoA synthetase short-chain family member 3, mitochondrial isoform X2 n=1 Tax=Phycodurus eques TaxID=693459 RepID=UPI002ACD4B03|nr:acyl-CoA synthetase short-chain family member 3, mitochondrial isoform X2 [Phycodurus eques]
MHALIPKVCTRSNTLGRPLWGVWVSGKTANAQRGCVDDAREAAAERYSRTFAEARDRPEQYWAQVGQDIRWFEPWSKTLDAEDPMFPHWFAGGKLNMCYNAVDRHVEDGRGEQAAVIYDSPVTGTKRIITYRELRDQVSRLAGVLVKNGVRKGDLVVIYMPMVPQAMFAMLACARVGAPHSLIFGGFASKELSPKMIMTASFGIEPGRRVAYVPLLEKALELSSHRPSKVLVYCRDNMEKVSMSGNSSLDWDEEMAGARPHDCVPVSSKHPLYILYTSGTTGTPKGVVRDTGGCAVMLKWTMSNVYGLRPGEVWWAASDLGWVVGHSYICYAPLLHGNVSILYEGKPVGTPGPGAYFRVLSEHGAASMFAAPTAVRAIRQQDPHARSGAAYPLPRLRSVFLAGERCDAETLEWAKRSFGAPVLDHWWQTETGSPITSTCVGLGNSLTPPAGQAGKPVPGYDGATSPRIPTARLPLKPNVVFVFTVTVIDDRMRRVEPGTLGNIVVRLPLPPGAASSLWQNPALFKEMYFTKFPGYYDTMDAGFVDQENFLYIMSRSDDVINVAGHRLSAGALEESVLQHPAVADCAVVGLEDPLKGHVPLALCVLKNGVRRCHDEVARETVKLVRDTVGPVAAFRKVLFVRGLPKTRSGKIPRSSLGNLVNGKPYKITPTIEDPEVFKEIEKALKSANNSL